MPKRVTAADVARSLGISRATVGFVLNNTPGQTISEATRTRVLDEASRLGYRPHGAARALASGRSHIILLVLPEWPLDYSMRTNLDEASATLDRAGYSLVTMTTHPDGQAQPLWETLRPDVVMGMTPLSEQQVSAIRRSGVEHILAPSLSADPLPGETDLAFDEGPRLQVEHLVAQGARTLAYAAPSDPRLARLSEERFELAQTAATSASHISWLGKVIFTEEHAEAQLAELQKAGVEGIVAYNDDIAALVTGTALRLGIGVPSELLVVGHDNSPISQLYVPSISTVQVDTAGIGRYLAELALHAATGSPLPQSTPELAAHVVQRETSGRR